VKSNSRLRAYTGRHIGASAAIGLSVATVGIVIEALVTGQPIISIDSLDNIITGIMASIVVFAYEQKRYSQTLENLRIVAEMNHHVRNALQVILCSRIFGEDEKQVKVIAEAARRIEWALREVLPGDRPSTKSGESERQT
jgi:hypothetical protein